MCPKPLRLPARKAIAGLICGASVTEPSVPIAEQFSADWMAPNQTKLARGANRPPYRLPIRQKLAHFADRAASKPLSLADFAGNRRDILPA
jgi:hypothetical protein